MIGQILAHGLGGRTDLPLPTWMVLYGGAAVVVVSFAALRTLWPQARWEGRNPGRSIANTGSPGVGVVSSLGTAFGMTAFLVVLVAALAGGSDPAQNIAPVAVYITFWVGLTFISGLIGDLWVLINPFDTMARLADDMRSSEPRRRPVPGWGYWPAAGALLGFVWLELVYPNRTSPRVLAVVMVLYTAIVLAGASRWGRAWLRHGEGFTALFTILGHGAPVGRDESGHVRVRAPFSGLASLRPTRGLDAVVLVVLGSTTFDGLTRTQWWAELSSRTSGLTNTVVGTAGLLAAIGTVWTVYAIAIRTMSRATDGRRSPAELGLAFAHSLVPIALAYSIAHYFSLFILEGQAVVSLISDPFGLGWDLFSTADHTINFNLLSPTVISYVQAGAIVVGHVAGVVVAHDRAIALFGPNDASKSQYPLLGAMVIFTVGGLFLLLGG